MPPKLRHFNLVAFLSCFLIAGSALAQQPAPSPMPEAPDSPDDVKVFTEEVRIPVLATDEKGRFDPTLEIDEILVLEDGVPQEVKSAQRIPASVMLLLGTGEELNRAMRVSTTRDIARDLLANLREGDAVALLQFNSRTDILQKWTTEKAHVEDALKHKLRSGRGSRLSQAIINAASYFRSQPIGNRHLVLVSDGVELPGRMGYKEAIKVLTEAESPEARALAAEAVKQLMAAQASVHVISYTAFGERVSKAEEKRRQEATGMAQSRRDIATVGIDPTVPPGVNRGILKSPQAVASITFDPQMRRLRKAYESAAQKSEQRLSSFTEETGGRLWRPAYAAEMIEAGREVAREIGAQYVITYKPKRPLTNASSSEYRRLRVVPRRIGLQLRARRGYVVAAMR